MNDDSEPASLRRQRLATPVRAPAKAPKRADINCSADAGLRFANDPLRPASDRPRERWTSRADDLDGLA